LGRGLDRRADRNVMIVASVILAIATIIILVFGLMWKWNLGKYYLWIAGYGYSAIGWHWGIALYLILPLLALHIWRRWPHPKKTDFIGRRQVLKLIGLGVASIAAWGTAEVLARSLQNTESSRRFTGSREAGSFTGNDHPVTSGPRQGKVKLDPSTWKLRLTGAVNTPLMLNYADVLALSISEVTATLDCTGGWYTTQVWRGIPLTDLLARAQIHGNSIGIILKGVSEYTAYYTLAQPSVPIMMRHLYPII
ncbi:MAG: molybdopterin-dependent oxidoreductase, partial [Chloroflexota bacterium]|nr:molybdopterin-dependent oxidoreductase [Chloroflexota bacterium]